MRQCVEFARRERRVWWPAILGAISSFLCLVGLSGAAAAQDGWRFQVTPYVWGTALDGTLTPAPGGPSFHAQLSPGEILDRLDAAFFVAGTARYGRAVAFGDLAYTSLSDEGEAARRGPYNLDVEGKLDTVMGTAMGGYAVVAEERVGVDLLAGARFYSMDTSVKATFNAAGRPVRTRTLAETHVWGDPLVGGRVRVDLLPRLSFVGQADLGGWDDRFSWQALGTLNYRVTDSLFLSAGYRHMSIDVGDEIDVDLGGPLVGATLRF